MLVTKNIFLTALIRKASMCFFLKKFGPVFSEMSKEIFPILFPVRIPISDFLEHFKIRNIKEYAIYTSALIVVYRMLTRSRLMSRQEHLVMVQSFVGNAADMNEFLIASYKGYLLMHRLKKT